MRFGIWMSSLLLGSCSSPSAYDEPHETKTNKPIPGISDQSARPVPHAAKAGAAQDYPDAAIKLYHAIKRLNAACVAAGGGVSGSPDCDTGTAKELELEKLGYCIDYPNHEKLARCADVKWRP